MSLSPNAAEVPRKWKWILSGAIVLHLLAVLLPPLSFQTQGPIGLSPVVDTASAPLRPYGQFLYIDRGYAFFAPDPGPSHLFQAAITDADGTRVEKMFPDLEQQWPRLLYHRHFMLAEYLNEIYQPPGPPRELAVADREAAEYWVRSRARYEHLRQSVVDHLRSEHPGQEVAIRRIEHLIPDLVLYSEEPIALDDPRNYRVMLDRPLTGPSGAASGADAETLAPPTRPAEAIPAPAGESIQSESSNESLRTVEQ